MKSETKAKAQKPNPKGTDGYVTVAATLEIPDGEHKVVEAGGQSVVVFSADGRYYALANECSHDHGPLGEGLTEGYEIACPRHGARFDIRTGKVLSFPAVADVPAYPVKVEGDKILVNLHPGG